MASSSIMLSSLIRRMVTLIASNLSNLLYLDKSYNLFVLRQSCLKLTLPLHIVSTLYKTRYYTAQHKTNMVQLISGVEFWIELLWLEQTRINRELRCKPIKFNIKELDIFTYPSPFLSLCKIQNLALDDSFIFAHCFQLQFHLRMCDLMDGRQPCWRYMSTRCLDTWMGSRGESWGWG